MACKKGQFDVVELMVNDKFKTFSINLNAQHVNGVTPFDLSTVIRYPRVTRFTTKAERRLAGQKFSCQPKVGRRVERRRAS